MALVVEFTVEPFTEGAPGLGVEFGPFGSTVEGPDPHVLDAVDAILRAAVAAGATRVSMQLTQA